MTLAWIWIFIGILLILSELLATSVIAVFLGIGAIVVGLALKLGLVETTAAQYTLFGIVSLASLLVARKQFKRWFVGFTNDETEQQQRFQQDLGERVTVHTDFVNGAGRVVLNGVQWDAVSEEGLVSGDVAWVVENDGIRLTVSRTKPMSEQAS
ncbi:MAG: NfeD family protein [Idiomarina sp.]|nr:NfeD family protein [Idiomarina sp.]